MPLITSFAACINLIAFCHHVEDDYCLASLLVLGLAAKGHHLGLFCVGSNRRQQLGSVLAHCLKIVATSRMGTVLVHYPSLVIMKVGTLPWLIAFMFSHITNGGCLDFCSTIAIMNMVTFLGL